ncbi:MAG TPA: YbdK family carboxylate-amine ligase [Euzebya sp.]|nr:YbdK family carboxylate-amine ligase [Euzebya sp.]
MPALDTHIPSAEDLRRAFDRPATLTVGIEEEVLLLDPASLDLLPRAADVVARSADPAVKLEMPASQLELLTTPAATVGQAAAQLWTARRRLQAAARDIGVLASAAVHPFAAALGVLNGGQRYAGMAGEYAWVARRQLVAGLQVHVAVGPIDIAVAVHNALRAHLPELAALAAAAPFHAGVDTGLASVRPKLAENLPRQGIPPAFADVTELAGAWRWAADAGAIQHIGQWWWEVRLHPGFGTIEVRVCDAQATVAETAALAGVIHALCGWLVQQAQSGCLPPPAPTWRIEANRWSACRHGVRGIMADLRTGQPEPTVDRLTSLLDQLGSTAQRLGCAEELASARAVLTDPPPDRHREIVAGDGLRGLCAWLVDRFTSPE